VISKQTHNKFKYNMKPSILVEGTRFFFFQETKEAENWFDLYSEE